MIVSLLRGMTQHQCSEPEDVRTLDDMISVYGNDHWLSGKLDLRDYSGGDIYQYSLAYGTHVTPYQPTVVDAHKVGDIVSNNGHHHIVVSADVTEGTKWLKQPEEYEYETDMYDYLNWTKRYIRLDHKNGQQVWTANGRTYYLQWVNLDSGCNGYYWRIRDNSGTNSSSTTDACGIKQGSNCYQNTAVCLQDNYTYSFQIANDIIGDKKQWKSNCGQLGWTLFLKSMVRRGDYLYLRTWCNVPVEYNTASASVHYELKRIFSPKEINGFRYNRKTKCHSVFDNKNYTKGIFSPSSGSVTFSYVTTDWGDTFAIGRVYGQSVSLTVKNESNKSIFNITDYPIYNQIADTNIGQVANVILYSDDLIPPSSFVEITIKCGYVNIGRLLFGRALSLGFSNTVFENGFKDFSPKEQDQWGNIEYKNGARVYVYSGTVDLPLSDYDALNRAFMHIGGNEMIINGSDTVNNTPPDSIEVFQSTMMIGRFTSFKQKTKNIGTIMDTIAGFTFAIQESV